MGLSLLRLSLGTARGLEKPAPFVSALVDAVDEAIRAQSPSHSMSAMQRAWRAFCVTAVLVTNAICWARFARASLGSSALAALSWMVRHSKMPWDALLVARVRVILRHYGLHAGSLVMDDTDNQRSKSAQTRAHRYKRRDKESGGSVWGQRLVFLVLVTPTISLPVGVVFSPPAPELSAWDKQEKALKKQGVPTKQRPSQPPANPRYPTKQALALSLLAQGKTHHPDVKVNGITADALDGTAPFVDGASVRCGGVPVISPIRSHQKVRLQQRAQNSRASFATHPGTPPTIRIRGGQEVVALVGRARFYVCAHTTKRFVVARQDEGEDTYRSRSASDLTWRTLDIVQGQTLRWLVAGCIQDWKSYEGWSQWPKQPGAEGARHSVRLSLLVDHALFFHPDQHAQLTHHLPAYTVGSLRAHVQVECLVDVVEHLVASDAPQEQRHRFTHALHQVFAFGRSTKPMIQRQLGRLEPTPALKDRADEVLRNMPALST